LDEITIGETCLFRSQPKYECGKVDMMGDPAWSVLAGEHQELAGMDLVRFTFELDEAVGEIFELVRAVFGAGRNSL